MKNQLLLATAALMLSATPALAEDRHDGWDIDYSNNIDTSIVNDTYFESDVRMGGYVYVYGEIDVDSSAVAISDPKQLLTGLFVYNREADQGCGCTDNPSLLSLDAQTGAITASGNLGVNVASGWFNQQANIATIAVSNNEDDVDFGVEGGGMAKANTTSLQSLLAVFYGPQPGGYFDGNNFNERLNARAGDINATGNIGVNVAAGAFNQQSNVMSIATASNAVLAEATAGVIQTAALSAVLTENPVYTASTGSITGSGNIGVNVAAGAGNQQHNSLTVANSSGGDR